MLRGGDPVLETTNMTRLGSSTFPVLLALAIAIGTAAAPAAATTASGPLSHATVSFGQWMSSPPLDRFPNSSPREANHHALIPNTVTIRAGGSVSFLLAGFHNVSVYGPDVQPADINIGLVRPTTGTPAGVPIIDDANRRVYRGLDPSTQLQDRIEVVHFATPGRYLAICGVLPHFLGGMYGHVVVLP